MLTGLAVLASFFCFTPGASAEGSDRIVVITDSHGVGSFGISIEQWLQGRPDTKYDFFASGASAPRQWTQTRFTTPCGFHQTSETSPRKPRKCYKEATPHLGELWSQQPVTFVPERKISVIALGTNYPLDAKDSEVATTKSLLKEALASSSICLWVGPPNMTRTPGYDQAGVEYKYGIIQDAIDAAAAETGKRCLLIDSRLLSSYPKQGGDGIHYQWLKTKDVESLGEAGKWASKVVEKLEASLR